MSKPRKTKSTAVSSARVTDAIRFAPNPIPQLTPENLSSYLDSFTRGYLRETALLWHAIQWRDDRVGADCNKRHKAVPRYGYKVVAAPGQKPDSPAVRRHIDAITFALDNLTAADVLDPSNKGGTTTLARQMMRAIGFQWQVHEIVWQPRPEGLTLQTTAMPLWWFERTTGNLRYLPQDLAIEGVPLEPDGWLITRGDGLMAATSVLYLLKRMALTDWAIYNGRVGPGIHGKTNASPDSDEWRTLEDAVDNFSFDLKMVTGDGVSINPIEMALKGTLPWPQMYEAMVKAITVLWRGGNLMTDSAGGPNQSGVTVQGTESVILEQDDGMMISEALNEYVVLPVIRYRFDEEPLAWVEWKTSAKSDVKADIEVDRFLAERNFPFTQEDLAQRYQRTLPQPGQTVLVPPAPMSPGVLPAVRAANSLITRQDLASVGQAARAEEIRNDLVQEAIDETLKGRARMFEKWLADLEASLPERATQSEYIDLVEAAIKEMPPQLLTQENIARLAKIGEGMLGTCVVNALQQNEAKLSEATA
jgi:phage gp29-like protein